MIISLLYITDIIYWKQLSLSIIIQSIILHVEKETVSLYEEFILSNQDSTIWYTDIYYVSRRGFC